MGPESRLKVKVLAALREVPYSWWEKIQQRTIRGTPDILGCVMGRFVAIELKADGGRLEALQAHKLEAIRAACGDALVVSPKTFDEDLEEIWRTYDSLRQCGGEK